VKPALHACLAIFMLTASGCTRRADPPPPVAEPAMAFDSIRLERTACFGDCPVYQLEIDHEGKGKFTGVEHVKAMGAHEVQLKQDDVALLSAVLNRSGFSSWKTSYFSTEDGCETKLTDQTFVTIGLTREGKTKTVSLYHGCHGPAIPTEAVDWLADTIDFVASTRALKGDQLP
jgi:hypothetical protein